jgi:transcription initiation factor IIE alpha subunit
MHAGYGDRKVWKVWDREVWPPEDYDAIYKIARDKSRLVNELRKANPIPENYACPICHKKDKKYYLDHDWKNKQFRGYLCNACNVALGLLKDDVVILNRAIAYLTSPQI